MGIALQNIPVIGELAPVERRDLARRLREVLPRGESRAPADVQAWLAAGPFGGEACVEDLLEVGWLEPCGAQVHADTLARRLAAAAVNGVRMPPDEAHALARTVRERILAVGGDRGGLRLRRVALYGSAVRSQGAVARDIGDLDLAFEVEVTGETLFEQLNGLAGEARWRRAMELSGWEEHLMQGDDRVTIAGSLAKLLDLYWAQHEGRTDPPPGKPPVLVVIWTHPSVREARLADVGTAPDTPVLEASEPSEPLGPGGEEVLAVLQAHTLRHHARASELERAITRRAV